MLFFIFVYEYICLYRLVTNTDGKKTRYDALLSLLLFRTIPSDLELQDPHTSQINTTAFTSICINANGFACWEQILFPSLYRHHFLSFRMCGTRPQGQSWACLGPRTLRNLTEHCEF